AFLKYTAGLYETLNTEYFYTDARLQRKEEGKEIRTALGAEDLLPYLVGYVLASNQGEAPLIPRTNAAIKKLRAILELYDSNRALVNMDQMGYVLTNIASALDFSSEYLDETARQQLLSDPNNSDI